jgi:hypothetical protein
MKATKAERARLTALLDALDIGSPPHPEVVTWLRSALQGKRLGRPPSPIALVRGAVIERLIQTGATRKQATEAVAEFRLPNGHELPPCSLDTAERHLDEFRNTWVPALHRLLVESQKLGITAEGIAAIESSAAKLNLNFGTTPQP